MGRNYYVLSDVFTSAVVYLRFHSTIVAVIGAFLEFQEYNRKYISYSDVIFIMAKMYKNPIEWLHKAVRIPIWVLLIFVEII